jgi:DNA-directed RNA polymerase alpha subunit
MTEREKPIYPTEKQIIERASSSPRMSKLFERKRVNFLIFHTKESSAISHQQHIEIIPYIIIKLPENNPDFYEIDFLGLSNRARNALARSGVKKISQLISLYKKGSLWETRGLGEKSLAEVQTKLEEFYETLIEKYKENPGKPVIIDTPPSPFWELW